MSISEQIETIIQATTNNNHPPTLVTITKAYQERVCDIITNNGETLKRVKCSNLAVEGTIALLTYEDGDPNHPFVLLFTDELNPCNFEVLNEELIIDFCGEARKGGGGGGDTPTDIEIVTNWSSPLHNDRVPSEKLTKDTLDTKAEANHSHIISNVSGLQNQLDSKQANLVSGTNIKTINNETLLGSGNIDIQGGGGTVDIVTQWEPLLSDTKVPSEKLTKNTIDTKQDTLISGTNIKTINNQSLLGSGNINIEGGGGSVIGTGSFTINSNGHLIVELPNAVDNPYYIDTNGHLYYDTTNTHNGD